MIDAQARRIIIILFILLGLSAASKAILLFIT